MVLVMVIVELDHFAFLCLYKLFPIPTPEALTSVESLEWQYTFMPVPCADRLHACDCISVPVTQSVPAEQRVIVACSVDLALG